MTSVKHFLREQQIQIS